MHSRVQGSQDLRRQPAAPTRIQDSRGALTLKKLRMTVLRLPTGTPNLRATGSRQYQRVVLQSRSRIGAVRVDSEQQLTQPSPNLPSIVTDAAVPEGHQSLHGLLYGSGDAADAHQAAGYQFREVRAVLLLPVPSTEAQCARQL